MKKTLEAGEYIEEGGGRIQVLPVPGGPWIKATSRDSAAASASA